MRRTEYVQNATVDLQTQETDYIRHVVNVHTARANIDTSPIIPPASFVHQRNLRAKQKLDAFNRSEQISQLMFDKKPRPRKTAPRRPDPKPEMVFLTDPFTSEPDFSTEYNPHPYPVSDRDIRTTSRDSKRSDSLSRKSPYSSFARKESNQSPSYSTTQKSQQKFAFPTAPSPRKTHLYASSGQRSSEPILPNQSRQPESYTFNSDPPDCQHTSPSSPKSTRSDDQTVNPSPSLEKQSQYRAPNASPKREQNPTDDPEYNIPLSELAALINHNSRSQNRKRSPSSRQNTPQSKRKKPTGGVTLRPLSDDSASPISSPKENRSADLPSLIEQQVGPLLDKSSDSSQTPTVRSLFQTDTGPEEEESPNEIAPVESDNGPSIIDDLAGILIIDDPLPLAVPIKLLQANPSFIENFDIFSDAANICARLPASDKLRQCKSQSNIPIVPRCYQIKRSPSMMGLFEMANNPITPHFLSESETITPPDSDSPRKPFQYDEESSSDIPRIVQVGTKPKKTFSTLLQRRSNSLQDLDIVARVAPIETFSAAALEESEPSEIYQDDEPNSTFVFSTRAARHGSHSGGLTDINQVIRMFRTAKTRCDDKQTTSLVGKPPNFNKMAAEQSFKAGSFDSPSTIATAGMLGMTSAANATIKEVSSHKQQRTSANSSSHEEASLSVRFVT